MAADLTSLKAIYSTNLDDSALTAHLETAAMVVSEQLTDDNLTTARKEKITLYLAAHFAAISESSGEGYSGPVKRSKQGDADESYASIADDFFGFETTRWGQMALALDTTGTLASSQVGKGVKARLQVI